MLKNAYALIALVVVLFTPEILNAQQLQLVDATGKVVGDVLGPGPQGAVSVSLQISGERFAVVFVEREQFFGEIEGDFYILSSRTLFFESTDCSGTPFINPNPRGVFANTTVVGDALYAAIEGAAAETIVVNSRRDTGGCRALGVQTYTGIEAQLAIDLAAEFVAPFAIKARQAKGRGRPKK